jgi:hypothetical protein
MNYDSNAELSNLIDKYLTFENIVSFILELKDEYAFFKNGWTFLDELLCSTRFKELGTDTQLQILGILETYKPRYSDIVYIEALWYPRDIQEWVKENLPREYSHRHIEDIENY